jgi:hypothetical protein
VMFDWFDVYTVDHYNTSNKRTNWVLFFLSYFPSSFVSCF